jgi:hypothetical protein
MWRWAVLLLLVWPASAFTADPWTHERYIPIKHFNRSGSEETGFQTVEANGFVIRDVVRVHEEAGIKGGFHFIASYAHRNCLLW